MGMKNNRLIVVLGMHRSGTSAITCGLQVMGVNLGDTLYGAMKEVNEKGFWEDIHLNALDVEMLDALASDWHHLAPISRSDVETLHNKGYFLRAVELLRQKVSDKEIFGFKDPRVAKLLPFWKEVFSHCQFDVSYVLALRHPLSVVKSLSRRDGFDAEKSYLLWLGHVITSLTGSAGSKRVLVDYDRLLQSPEHELDRIANCTNLRVDPAEVRRYKTEFLDRKLRHTVYEPSSLFLDNACPPMAREIYTALLDVASDNTQLDDSGLQKKIEQWSGEFERLNSHLLLLDRLFTQKAAATRTVAERNGQIASLNQAVTERDEQIANLNQAVAECNDQVVNLDLAVQGKDVHINNLNQTIQAITNSLSWRMMHPLRKAFSSSSSLRIVVRRAAKLVWWAMTLQLGNRLREWRLSKGMKGPGKPHFAPPSDDCYFKVPFEYPVERTNITPSVAVVCHMYYPAMLEEFKGYLANIPFPFDLFITTDTEQKKNDIASSLLDWDKGAVEIRLAPNRGRDIAPKLVTCRDVYDRYEFFLHIHSKKSPHKELLSGWRTYLLETLLGSEKIVAGIFDAFESDPKLGIIAPQHFDPVLDLIGWGCNFEAARKFARKLGIKLLLDEKIDFPSGSMFWGRSAALSPLLISRLSTEDFPPETGQLDATLGHILERLYYFVCEKAGYRWIKIVRPELLKNVERMIYIENKESLKDLIKQSQYGLLVSKMEKSGALPLLKNNIIHYAAGVMQSWRTVHAKSELHTMEFSQFCEELEKYISKQASMIEFDEDFYLAANRDVAEAVAKGNVSCGYVHYCLAGQYEGRIHSDRQLKHRFSIQPSYPSGFLAPVGDRPLQPLRVRISLAQLPQSPQPFLLILFSHLQEDLFFAGYSEFFKDHGAVFERFDRVIIAVESAKFDKKLASRYLSRIEVMHLSEIGSLKYKPDIVIGFNAHLTCAAYQMLPDTPERVVYYCQDFESGFFPFGADYIVGEKAIADSRNLVVSTELLNKFLSNRGLVNAQHVFVTRPMINILDVPEIKTKRLFFYYRPEFFHKRNMPDALMDAVREFCYKHNGYEIYMVGSVATAYSFKINGTQVYVINKLPKNDYVELISSCDVVVSMIYSAHPGVIAFQAAASGIPTVTNVFENRDASLLKNISKNIVPYDPVRGSLLAAIEQALAMPKGQAAFNEVLYSGNQQGSLANFYTRILSHRATENVRSL
jgi:hypothetical protein